jgi:hypothetical protein
VLLLELLLLLHLLLLLLLLLLVLLPRGAGGRLLAATLRAGDAHRTRRCEYDDKEKVTRHCLLP